MRTTWAQLEEWQRAGLLTPEQVAAIDRYERGRPAEAGRRRPVFAEALGYVGAALALGAVALLVGEFWTEFTALAQLVLVGTLTAALLGAGLALRRVGRASMQRLVSVLWLGAVVGVGWFAGIVAGEFAGLEDERLALAVGAAAFVVATVLYLLRQRALAQLAVLASLLVVATAALSLPDLPPHAGWYGLTAVGVGAAWFGLGLGGWLQPRLVAAVAGAAVMVFACQFPWEGQEWLLPALGVLIAGGLVWLSVATDALPFLVVGALGLFQLVPRLVFEVFGEAIGGAASMLVVGLLLVLAAVGLGRAGREIRRGPEGPQGDHPDHLPTAPHAPTRREVSS